MSAPGRGGLRVARVTVLGGASMMLAAGAHQIGGGTLPSAPVLVVLSGLVGLVAVTATARRCRLGVLLVLLGVEQLLLHQVLSASSTLASACGASVAAHHATAAGCWSDPMAGGAMDSMGWSMLLGHTAATAGTAWVLARAEAWCWRAADRIIRVATAAPVRRVRPARPLVLVPAIPGLAVAYAPAAPRGPPWR